VSRIERHTGGASFDRGLRYYHGHRVQHRHWDGDRVFAEVLGSHGHTYNVDVFLAVGSIVDSSCSCPMQTCCKHVAAALLAYLSEPATFQGAETSSQPEGPDTSSHMALEAWARARKVDDALHRDIKDVLIEIQGYAPRLLNGSVNEFLLERRKKRWIEELRIDVGQWLARLSTVRKDAAAYTESAREWRSIQPEEPLVSLWHMLRTRLAHVTVDPWDEGLTGCPDFLGATIQEDPPALRLNFWPAIGRIEEVVPLQPATTHDLPGMGALAAVLDLITHPDLADMPLRRSMLREISVAPWQRAVAALDRSLAKAAPRGDPEGREQGWRIRKHHGSWEVSPVWCSPYKTKDGLRSWNLSLHDAPLALPADRAAAAILEGVGGFRTYRTSAVDNRVLRATAQLVGHPLVILDKGLHINVRRATLDLHWEPTRNGGIEVQTRLDGHVLDRAQVVSIADDATSDLSWLVDAAGRRIHVISLAPSALALLGVLAQRGGSFPAEARRSLMQRFEDLSQHMQITLGGELRGDQVPGDSRPLIRLLPSPDGSLELEVLSRVLENGRAWPPGGGPTEVAALRHDHRVFVRRDLRAEEEHYRGRVDALGLPEQQGFEWKLDDPEIALPVMLAMRAAGEEVQVEWRRPYPEIKEAYPKDLEIEAVKKRDWFGIAGGIEIGSSRLSLSQLLESVRSGKRFVQLPDGVWIEIAQALLERLEAAAATTWEGRNGLELPPMAIGVFDEVEAAGAKVDVPDSWAVQTRAIAASAELDVAVPKGLTADLRPYQQAGFEWLARLSHWAPGAVLADDMGLGKTIQALTLLLRRASAGPALVVAPASVGINWAREAGRFAPSLELHSYRGPKRAEMLPKLGPGDVIVTSWELMARDIEILAEVVFATAVLDEAQAIKNPTTARAKASTRIDAGFVLSLTGTPVENRVGELWSLLRTTVPGLLGSAERFRSQFGAPHRRFALSRLLQPFLLRRLKEEVATELPPITEIDVRVELSPDERERYEDFRAAAIEEALNNRGPGSQMKLLAAMTRMRQLACDIRLVDKDSLATTGTKLERLRELIGDLRQSGHRALVFSQFTTLLQLARDALEADGARIRYLDGSMPMKKRQVQVDAFQGGDGDVFLISLKAGGVGLNLTAASYVIHLDPWWNPATEDQATDRAHRIGQDKPVTVYRLVAADTIEDVVLQMHADKRAMVDEILDGTSKGAGLTTSEMIGLLRAEGVA